MQISARGVALEVDDHGPPGGEPLLLVMGLGMQLALACDMRIAADDAKLTTAFSKIGLSGDFGGSFFLTHLVGAAKARGDDAELDRHRS